MTGNIPTEGMGFRILMYHSIGGRPEDHSLAIRVPAENFKKQMDEVAGSGYQTFTVSELVRDMSAVLARKSIVLTFDDGYKDNILTAAVVLKEMGLKATFFITTSYIDHTADKRWAGGQLREFMTWEDIAALSGMGFEIGSHMAHHVDLTSLADDQLRSELEVSRDMIKRRLGGEVSSCSYPYGNVDERVTGMAKSCGYLAGCSSFSGWNNVLTNPYLLKRTEIDGYDIIQSLNLKLAGYFD